MSGAPAAGQPKDAGAPGAAAPTEAPTPTTTTSAAAATQTSAQQPHYGRGNRRRHFIANACQFCLQLTSSPLSVAPTAATGAAAAGSAAAAPAKLRVCSKCKAISYCSVAHQKADWPAHRRTCSSYQHLRDETVFPPLPTPCTDEEWWTSRATRIKALDVLLCLMGAAPLDETEQQMLIFAKHCEVCHTTDRDLLLPCSSCHMVNYCSAEHREADRARHQPQCLPMLFALRCMQTERMYDLPPIWIPASVLSFYMPLPPDWTSYLTFRYQPAMPEPENAFICTTLSTPLTILYALERMSIPEAPQGPALHPRPVPVFRRRQLCLHLLGATSSAEALAVTKYEELLHILPDLERLEIVLVGPEVGLAAGLAEEEGERDEDGDEQRHEPPGEGGGLEGMGGLASGAAGGTAGGTAGAVEHTPSSHILCDVCARRGRELRISFVPLLYHDAVARGLVGRPHAAVICNGDLEQAEDFVSEDGDTWESTLTLLLDRDIPTVVTARHVASSDMTVDKLETVYAAAMVLRPQINPYMGLVPHRIPYPPSANYERLWYSNQYVMAFCGRCRALAGGSEAEADGASSARMRASLRRPPGGSSVDGLNIIEQMLSALEDGGAS